MALVALQEIQAQAGYIPAPAPNALAKALGVPEGEILGVISFYPELRTTPLGRHRVCICRGDSCAARGSHRIAEAVEAHLGVPPHSVSPDGQFTYDTVYCLGNCALSPSISIDEEVYGRCTEDGVVKQLRGLPDA
jgi:formate dehydrogenase subunit gamma